MQSQKHFLVIFKTKLRVNINYQGLDLGLSPPGDDDDHMGGLVLDSRSGQNFKIF